MKRLLFLSGPAQIGDLNFVSRVFGKFASRGVDAHSITDRAVIVNSTHHEFRLRSINWFWKRRAA